MNSESNNFHWAKLVVSCLKERRGQQTGITQFVDYEVIPPLDGSPDEIFVWFICARDADAELFRSRHLKAETKALHSTLLRRGFPPNALSSLESDVTSQEAIEAGGGRFYFFR